MDFIKKVWYNKQKQDVLLLILYIDNTEQDSAYSKYNPLSVYIILQKYPSIFCIFIFYILCLR